MRGVNKIQTEYNESSIVEFDNIEDIIDGDSSII